MKTIENFLSLYAKNSSKGVRRAGLYAFLEYIGDVKRKSGRAMGAETSQFENCMKEYSDVKRDYYDDVLRFAVSLNNKPPLTARSYISSVKEYFGYNGIEFTAYQLKNIRFKLPKGKTRTEEADMTKDVIERMSF